MPTAEFGAGHISDKVHKGIAHYIYDDAAKHAAMTDYVRHHARQVARLVDALEAIPDAGGGSVMDNTLIVCPDSRRRESGRDAGPVPRHRSKTGFHSRARCAASARWASAIRRPISSRIRAALARSSPTRRDAARLSHR